MSASVERFSKEARRLSELVTCLSELVMGRSELVMGRSELVMGRATRREGGEGLSGRREVRSALEERISKEDERHPWL